MKEANEEDMCSLNVGEDREPSHIQPGVVLIALSCPENCDQCIVSKFGSLVCTMPATGYMIEHGRVVDACQTDGYVAQGDVCHSCSYDGGCKTCTLQEDPDTNMTRPVCSECMESMGFTGTEMPGDFGPEMMCVQTECPDDPTKYYNGTD